MSEPYRTIKSYWFVAWVDEHDKSFDNTMICVDGDEFSVKQFERDHSGPGMFGIVSIAKVISFQRVTETYYTEFHKR